MTQNTQATHGSTSAKATTATTTTPIDFATDQFALRRNNTGYGNPYDAESLLTGAEVVQGLDYDNSYRQWPDEATKRLGAEGKLSTEEVLRVAPRVRKEAGVKPGVAETGYPLRDTDW